jgi:hypothetical protein
LADRGYVGGKWFATSFEDAVRWGRALQRLLRPRPFRVAFVAVPATLLDEFASRVRLDAIGPAYFVRSDQLRELSEQGLIGVSAEIYEVEVTS